MKDEVTNNRKFECFSLFVMSPSTISMRVLHPRDILPRITFPLKGWSPILSPADTALRLSGLYNPWTFGVCGAATDRDREYSQIHFFYLQSSVQDVQKIIFQCFCSQVPIYTTCKQIPSRYWQQKMIIICFFDYEKPSKIIMEGYN